MVRITYADTGKPANRIKRYNSTKASKTTKSEKERNKALNDSKKIFNKEAKNAQNKFTKSVLDTQTKVIKTLGPAVGVAGGIYGLFKLLPVWMQEKVEKKIGSLAGKAIISVKDKIVNLFTGGSGGSSNSPSASAQSQQTIAWDPTGWTGDQKEFASPILV